MRTARPERPRSPADNPAGAAPVARAAVRLRAMRSIHPVWLLAALAGVWAIALCRFLAVGTDDLALAGVFSTDEELSGRIVHHMLAARTLSPSHFFAYGALYHELAALVALPLSLFRPDEQAALLGLRTMALLGGVATIALTYALGARLYGAWAGLLSAVLVALSAELADWSITAHPDTVQLACIAAGLLVTCSVLERPARGRIALAAAFAGLAFATKYGGVLLLPLVLLAATEGRRRSQVSKDAPIRAAAGDLVVAGAVFAAVFLVTNPYVVPEWRRFITQARAELQHAQSGHVFRADASPWEWLVVIAGGGLLGPAAAIAAGAGAWLAARRVWRSRALDGSALVALWAAGYLSYLLVAVRYQEGRYALPLLPSAAVLAAGALAAIWRARPAVGVLAGAALALVTVLASVPELRTVYREREERAERLQSDPRVLAGVWLRERVPPGATVLADAYVYVPGDAGRHAATFGLTESEVAARRPVVIATNEDIRGRFRDPDAAGRYVDGAAAYLERMSAYARLESGALGCYVLVQDFGPVRLYADERALRDALENGCGTVP